MKWFKHISDSLDDPFIFELITKHGSTGYLVFFGVLEIYAREFKTDLSWNLCVTIPYLKQKFQQSHRQLITNPLQTISNSGKWQVTIKDDQITIFIPKFRELMDEWSLRKLGSHSGVTPKILKTELDKELDKDKETTLVPSGTTSCPHLKIIEEYNRILGAYLPQVKPHLWKGKRASWLASRWKERESRQNIEWWSGLFERVKGTPFLIGKNDREWKVDLEWIVKDSNFVKILEGKYEKKTGRNVAPGNGSGQLRVLDGVPSGTDKGKESNTGPPETHRGQSVEGVALPLANDGRGRHGEVEEGT